ncbi:Csu type fimbrial protein [Burkholderia ubonensis]|uniref:Spore coat protein U domain-contain protein n=1 Tax=Burkholderia ubonensis TaxID=101571 RepID=A0A1R1J6B2_9BURK|nr:spore coat U domain-containing protein [Burkholderia ubonensis]OMG70840.1 spore coat protein U domain-contain protein [Burkholderia ubonensis]
MWARKRAVILLSAAMIPAASVAETTLPKTRTFMVSARIVAGCGVVGGGPGTGLDFGSLDFGVHTAVAHGDVSAAAGGSGLQIECTPGSTLKMTIDGGASPSAGNTQRNLKGAGGTLIPYRLYADAGHAQSIGVGQAISIPVSGGIALPIYGALTLPGGTAPAGAYADTAQVTLSY